jgi:hypothetical protein
MAKSTVVSLPPVPFNFLYWQDLRNQFDERTLHRIHRFISEIQFDNLRYQVYVIATSLRNELQMPITDTGERVLCGHPGGLVNARTTWHVQHLTSDKPIAWGRPKSVQSEADRQLIEFRLTQQREKNHVTVQAATDFMAQNGTQSVLEQSLRQAK